VAKTITAPPGRLRMRILGVTLQAALAVPLSPPFTVAARDGAAGRTADLGSSAPSAAGAAQRPYAPCSEICAPGNLIFLPCMAVGARNMAACREREIGKCREACARRPR
jgi:hypothetical protein